MRSDRYQPDVPPYALYALLGASLVLNVIMVIKLDDRTPADAPAAVVQSVEAPAAQPAPTLQQAPSADPVVAEVAAPVAEQQAAELSPSARAEGWQVANAKVEHSLARTISNEVDTDADALAAVYSRLFMWDLDLRRDVQKGDEVWLLWRPVEGQEPEIAAAWYKSQKLGRTLQAYRFQAPGDSFASYWRPDGSEASLRLQGGPIEGYDIITSLLKDRPTHKGMDFRAPVGTDVVAPKAGTVTRVNWNHKYNGNCIEVRYPDGTTARFLHLDALQVREGQYVQAGQVLAASGNTGRSTAPHLHYEMDKAGKVLDPVDYHGTLRRHLPDSAMGELSALVNDMDAKMGTPVASR